MPTKLTDKAREGSTYAVQVEFNEKAPDGTRIPFVPNSGLTWSLVDDDGNPVNNRTDVVIDPPLQTVIITLSGLDLALPNNNPVRRYITVKGTYNGLAGSNLPMIDEASFQIVNLKGEG